MEFCKHKNTPEGVRLWQNRKKDDLGQKGGEKIMFESLQLVNSIAEAMKLAEGKEEIKNSLTDAMKLAVKELEAGIQK